MKMKQFVVIVIVVIIVIIVVVTDQVHTTETDPLQQPTNVTCVFHARKTVSCRYQVPDDLRHNSYSCHIRPCFGYDCNQMISTCKDHNLSKAQNTTTPGRCHFDCKPPRGVNQCLEDAFIVIINGRQPNKEVFYCSSINLKQIEKPGPVINLRQVKVGRRFLKLNWTKPDRYDDEGYNYTISISGGPKGMLTEIITNKQTIHVRKKVKGLSAWTSYNVTVTADRAFHGDPTTITVLTKEDVPLSSPAIPSGSFSVINSTTLMLYPKFVPKEEQQGEIIRYETLTKNYISFHSLLVDRDADGGLTVSLRAATKVGLSEHPTRFTVSKKEIETQSITSVSLEDGVLKWTTSSGEKHFRVYYCSGKMKQNVARCQDEIQHQDVDDRMEMNVEDLDCDSDCLFAVSGQEQRRAGMVWSSGLRTVVVEALQGQDGFGTQTILFVVLVVIVLVVAIGGFCYLMKKKGMFSNYVIHLPEFKHHLLDNKPDTKEDEAAAKHKPLRDSGNASMGTDVTVKGTVTEMSGVSNPLDPTVKRDASPQECRDELSEICGESSETRRESSEARRESSHHPGKVSASGGSPQSKGGSHPSTVGSQSSIKGSHPITDTSAEETTEESLWDNSNQSCVSDYRQFAAIRDGSCQDSSTEKHGGSSGKYCDEQTIDHCHPSSWSGSSIASFCSQSGPSASSYSAVLVSLDSSNQDSINQDSSNQESSNQDSIQDSSNHDSSQKSSRSLKRITLPKRRYFTKKSSHYS